MMTKKFNTTASSVALLVAIGFSPVDSVLADELELIRGIVKARDEAVYNVNLQASVLETPFRAGETFAKGDTLLAFDCSEQHASVKAAQASHGAAQATHRSNKEMLTYGAVGKYEVNLSAARLKEAAAQAEVIVARTKDCVITAPYDGKVSELAVNVHETPRPDQPVLKIIGVNEYELRLIVPSSWLSWLAPGAEFSFAVDEVGQNYPAKVKQLGAEVDAVSKTIQIIAQFDQTPVEVLPGMSGTARFNQVQN